MEIGSRMEEICEDAYMNGYNWEAFLNSYLEQNDPEIYDAIETDSEADMYCAYINDTSDEGKELAKQYVQILEDLFDDEEDIYDFLKHNAGRASAMPRNRRKVNEFNSFTIRSE